MKTEFHGLEELLAELQHVEKEMESTKKDALVAGGEVMQKATKENASQLNKTGRATGNLERQVELSDVKNDEIEVYVDNQGKAYYGEMLEIGTSKMPAYPFMGPAFNASTGKMQEAMASTMRNRLRSFL